MINTALFDIETSDLDADRGIILCAVIQPENTDKPIVLRTDDMNHEWKKGKRGDDKAIAREIAVLLSQFDILVAHNGTWFDIPFIRSRCAYWSLPRVPDIKIIDPVQIARRKFRFRSNALKSLSDFARSPDKKHVLDWSVWTDAILNGTRKSMDEIVEHCKADVRELRDVLNLVKPYIKVLDDRGSSL